MTANLIEVSATAKPAINKGYRLQFEPAQNIHVLLYPEGMVKLNGSACEILKRCDGERTVSEIVADLESTYNQTGLTNDVNSFLVWAIEKQWLELRA
jgi:pyrroloquinoline quinone biosynthesis protein D